MLNRSLERILAAVVLLLFSGLASACEQRSDEPAPAPRVTAQQRPVEVAPATVGRTDLAFERPLLWRVSRADVPHTSYLFGTVHAGFDVQWLTLPPAVREAFEASDTVMLEAQVDDSIGRRIASRMVLPPDQSLRSGLGDETFALIQKETGVPPTSLDRFRPWVVHSMLVEKWTEGAKPMDLKLLVFAQARNKPLEYLETVEEQVDMLDQTITMKLLAETVEDVDAQKAALQTMVDAYKVGDRDALAKAAFADEVPADLIDAMFRVRNERWSPRIDVLLRQQPTFVAAGAGHFIGPDNVIEDLRERGWTIERVAAKTAD